MEQSEHFGHQFKLLSKAFDQAINRNSQAFGLTAAQSFLLFYVLIHNDQAIYARTLEHALHLSHPTIAGIVQRLETKGFIHLSADEADRRRKRILPTQKALVVQDQARQRLDLVERQLVEGFTPDEVAQLHALLDRAADNLGVRCNPFQHAEQKEEPL